MSITVVTGWSYRPPIKIIAVPVASTSSQFDFLILVVDDVGAVAVDEIIRQFLKRRIRESITEASVVAIVTVGVASDEVVSRIWNLLRRRLVRQHSTDETVLIDGTQIGNRIRMQEVQMMMVAGRLMVPRHEPVFDGTRVGPTKAEMIVLQ